MPLSMTVSVLALYNEDNHIFDNMQLPSVPINHYDPDQLTGYPDLMRPAALLYAFDRTSFLQYLMLQTAQLSTIYPEPETFKMAVALWSATRIQIWQELYDTLFFRYNPIWNKDGTLKSTDAEVRNFANTLGIVGSINHGKTLTTDHGHPTETLTRMGGHTETDTDTRKTKETHGGTDTTTDQLRHTETDSVDQYSETHQITQDDVTGQVAGYDSSSFENRDKSSHLLTETNTPAGSKIKTYGGGDDKSELEHGETVERETLSGSLTRQFQYGMGGETETKTYTGDDIETARESGSTGNSETRTGSDTGTGSHTIDSVERGNIGTTSTQSLIQQERELIKFNLYEYILQDFKANFLVLVY